MSIRRGLFNGYALIVGVGTYQHGSLSVDNTAWDAEDLYAVLTDPALCAYPPDNVTLLTHQKATSANITKALADLQARVAADRDATVFIFFSGHGWQGDDYYFLTHETVLSGPADQPQVQPGTALPNRRFLEEIRKILSQRLVIVINTCYSGSVSLSPQIEQLPQLQPISLGLFEKVDYGSGRVIISSSKENERSYVLAGDRNSLFVKHLLDGLRGEDGGPDANNVRIFALFEHLSKVVGSEARKNHIKQTPNVKIDADRNFEVAYKPGGAAAAGKQSILNRLIPMGPGAPAPSGQEKPTLIAPEGTSQELRLVRLNQEIAEKNRRLESIQERIESLLTALEDETDEERYASYNKRWKRREKERDTIKAELERLEAERDLLHGQVGTPAQVAPLSGTAAPPPGTPGAAPAEEAERLPEKPADQSAPLSSQAAEPSRRTDDRPAAAQPSNSAVPNEDRPRHPLAYTARQDLIEKMVRTILETRYSVGIYGMSGTGKTTVADTVYARVKDAFTQDGYSWYTATPYNDAAELLRQIALFYKFNLADQLKLEERVVQLRAHLGGRAGLIYLDDVTAPHIVKHLQEAAPNFTFLVTSENRICLPDFLERFPLNELSADEAYAMFVRVAGVKEPVSKRTAADIKGICRIIGFLPAAVNVLARRLRESPMDLALVRRQFEEAKNILPELGEQYAIAFDFSYQRLSPADQRLFASLGSFFGEDFTAEAAAAVNEVSDARNRLNYFCDLSLLKRSAAGRFTLHTLLKEFACGKIADRRETALAQARYYLNHALVTRHPLHALDVEVQNIFGCLKWCLEEQQKQGTASLNDFIIQELQFNGEQSAEILYRLSRMYRRRGDYHTALAYLDQSLAAARAAGMTALEAAGLRSQGEIEIEFMKNEQVGLDLIRQAIDVCEKSQEMGAKIEQIYSYNLLARLYKAANQLTDAKKYALDSLVLRDQLKLAEADPQRGYSYAAVLLVDILLAEDNVMEASTLLQKERSHFEPINLAIRLTTLGLGMMKVNAYQAARLFDDALSQYESLNNLGGCAWVSSCQGELAFMRRQHESAIEHYKAAFELRQQAGEDHMTGSALVDLARIYYRIGQPDQSEAYWAQFIEDYRDRILNTREMRKNFTAEAIARYAQAILETLPRPLGAESLKARVMLEEAETFFDADDNWQGVADIKQLLGDYWLAANRPDTARTVYAEAINLWQFNGKPLSQAAIIEQIGDQCAAEKQPGMARMYWHDALNIYAAHGEETHADLIRGKML